MDLDLERLPDGTYRYVDPSKMFTMTVAPDGRAYFADRWRRPSSADSQHGKIGRRPGARSIISNGAGLAMRGPSEFILQALGSDLSTGAKMAALRRTEAFRTDLAIAWNRQQVRKRLNDLPAELLALWHDPNISLERRREILFEHWDACEDRLGIIRGGLPADAVPEVDELRRDAGEQARRTIEGFVRSELDGDEAFTAAELESFNTRRVSVSRFDPYTVPTPPPPPPQTPSAPSSEDTTEAPRDQQPQEPVPED